MQGRVEICNRNVWGTVCDDFWGTTDAQVACRQLGFATTGSVALFTGFTNGAGQIWLDNVQCRGTERRLIDCPANPLGSHNCGHIEDAGVRCVRRKFTYTNFICCCSLEVSTGEYCDLSFFTYATHFSNTMYP